MSRDPSLERDLDRAIEAGLREQVRVEGCPSIELVAAYGEHLLAADEVSRWEEHFAGCRRCQQLLAAMARVEPAVPPVEVPAAWVRMFDWRWLVPATAAATAATVWIALRPASTPAPLPAPAAIERRESAPLSPPAQERFATRVPEPTPDLTTKAEKPAHPGQPLREAERQAKKDAAKSTGDTVTGPAQAPPVNTPAAPPAAAEPKALLNRAGSIAAAAADAAKPREAGIILNAPGRQVQWRLGSAGEIGRSQDGGATWEVQHLGAGQDLLGGAAASDSVCWVVGRGGTILRTIDGRTWSRVESPVAADIVGVVATDASAAVIRTADGQRFITRDGGKTWERLEPF